MSYFIEKDLSKKVLMVSVIFRTSKPCGGGVSTVLECYDKYFNGLRHIPTWKRTNAINKVWYFAYHYLLQSIIRDCCMDIGKCNFYNFTLIRILHIEGT